MPSKEVLDYLRKYKGKYKLEKLKKKLISSGYSREEVEEASTQLREKDPNSKGIKKMKGKGIKIGAIVGFIFLFFSLVGIILNLLKFNFSSLGITGFIGSLIMTILLVPCFFIYIYGFIKMGKALESKMLRFSSIGLLVTTILAFILIIALALIVFFSLQSLGLPMSGNQVEGLNTNSLFLAGGAGIIFGIGFLFLGFVDMVLIYIFYAGLILVRKRVRFAGIAGWLGVILVTLLIVSSLGSMFVGIFSKEIGTILFLVGIVFNVLLLALILFQNLTLIKAAEMFEK